MVVYSFRTFPMLAQLPAKTFVFSKLKEDLETLKHRIGEEQPEYLIGIAATKRASRIEPVAINKFNQGSVIKNGADKQDLFAPEGVPFKLATVPTHSFCNWTMYKLQDYINQSDSKTRLMFFHINLEDMEKLSDYLKQK